MGKAREIREWIEAWNQSDIEQSLAQNQIKWKFNPLELQIKREVQEHMQT